MNFNFSIMPLPKYRNRCFTIYFKSEQHLKDWSSEAKTHKSTLNRYLLEMAEKGRAGEKAHSKGDAAGELMDLRNELNKHREENKVLNMIREKLEAEVLKLKHREFLETPGPSGRRQYSEELIDLLKQGGTWPGHEILKALHIPPEDSEASQIILAQLRGMQAYGRVKESIGGWKWIP